MKKITQLITLLSFIFLFVFSTIKADAHCEIPCGIYGDSTRVALLYEHIATVEKSMKLIKDLSAQDSPDHNQLVRWVMNKEEHAKKIQDIVSQYFLHQRVKITSEDNAKAYGKYLEQLELLHKISVFAMKSKQSTDLKIIDKLKDTVHNFEHSYFGGGSHSH